MALPYILAALSAGNQPLSKIDSNFTALGNIVTIPSTASGTNAITLTPAANTPTISAYNQLQAYRFVAANNSTGSVTLQVNALTLLKAYKATASGPVQLGSGDIVATEVYDAIYDLALDSGTGGFHVFNVIPAASTPVIDAYYYDEYTTNTALATTTPADDTVPLSTEGNQVTTRTLTLTSASQKVGVFFDCYVGPASGQSIALSIFRGTTCIQTAGFAFGAAGGTPHVPISCSVLDSPATTGSITYSARIGADSGSVYLNGTSGGRLYGGSSRATQWTYVFHS